MWRLQLEPAAAAGSGSSSADCSEIVLAAVAVNDAAELAPAQLALLAEVAVAAAAAEPAVEPAVDSTLQIRPSASSAADSARLSAASARPTCWPIAS